MKKDYMGLNTDLLKHINILDIEVGSDDYRNHNSSWVAETRNKGVPHIFIMKNEKVLDEYSGNRTTKDMVDFIEKYVKPGDARSKPDDTQSKPVRSNKLSKLPSSIAIYKKTLKKNKKRKRGKTGKKPKKNKKRKPKTR
jgi:Mg-chelatase subunit ChlI